MSLAAAVLGALLCGAGGTLVPPLIRRIPEPDPEPDPEPGRESGPEPDPEPGRESGPESDLEPEPGDDGAEEPKEAYAAIAALPGLAAKAAVAGAVAGAVIGAALGLAWPLVFLFPLVPVGVALALVDWRTRLLPTRVIAPTYLVLVPLVVAVGLLDQDRASLARAGLGWALAGGFFGMLWLIRPGGLGYGDVRLSGILGIALGYLGWVELFWGLWSGFLLGGLGGLALARLGLVDRRSNPFGPWMLLGALVGIVWGAATGTAVTA